mgnify:CR=1 FL=1
MAFHKCGNSGGGVEVSVDRCVTYAGTHSGSQFTIANVPSKPIVAVVSYVYANVTYAYLTAWDGSKSINDFGTSSAFFNSYDENTKTLTMNTASTMSLSYRIVIFY